MSFNCELFLRWLCCQGPIKEEAPKPEVNSNPGQSLLGWQELYPMSAPKMSGVVSSGKDEEYGNTFGQSLDFIDPACWKMCKESKDKDYAWRNYHALYVKLKTGQIQVNEANKSFKINDAIDLIKFDRECTASARARGRASIPLAKAIQKGFSVMDVVPVIKMWASATLVGEGSHAGEVGSNAHGTNLVFEGSSIKNLVSQPIRSGYK
ncbi:hypothetical protein ACUXVY_22840 [Chromobacterium haemolyticum]|uniref:hypothetical protein n=1 Tax=Chromobacterium haemolyticum TaxID=394935 RepID=UPI004057353C